MVKIIEGRSYITYHGNSFYIVGDAAFTLNEGDAVVENGADDHSEGEYVGDGGHCMVKLSLWGNVVEIGLQVAATLWVESGEVGFTLEAAIKRFVNMTTRIPH